MDFFEQRGHLLLPPSPLVSDTTLFTTAGMQQLMPYFRGSSDPPSRRLTSCQPCLRTTDIDQVGLTDRHLTLFEMLGNFSIGDYFREEMLPWSIEFSVGLLGLPKERLWVSVFGGDSTLGLGPDEESERLWRQLGIPEQRIVQLGRSENFWQPGLQGPSGPCTEIYFDRGLGCGSISCRPGCDCDRFLEFWNIVLTQYEIDSDEQLSPLQSRNVDTGLGVERTLLILEGGNSVFDVGQLGELRQELSDSPSSRILCDHLRSSTRLIEEGLLPSNEGRGYVLRRLLRRLLYHCQQLDLSTDELIDRVSSLGSDDPLTVWQVVEEERLGFERTIDRGNRELEKLLRRSPRPSGREIHQLYETHGLPVWLSCDILRERGIVIDQEGIELERQEHRQRSRTQR